LSATCICSTQDIAAQNIKRQLLTLYPFTEKDEEFDRAPIYQFNNLSIVTIKSDSIYADRLDRRLSADVFIFASRHKSASFKPALLVHTPGNWAMAELGGKPSTLCTALPSAVKMAHQTLLSERNRLELDLWACGLEATHHGPWIEEVPTLFVEIGSSEQEWRNEVAGKIVARAIIAVAENLHKPAPAFLGFGGPHYCPAFTRLSIETDYAASHLMPKYHLNQVSESLVRHAVERTAGPIELAALDWKGMKGSQRKRLSEILDKMNIEAHRVRDLLRVEKGSK
jgi:D-aminoacyl-tRNA deacylase